MKSVRSIALSMPGQSRRVRHVTFAVWLCCIGLLAAACVPVTPGATIPPAPTTEIANPASQNCVDQGGSLTLETRGDGGQYGVCVFEDNRQCEEWALLRGECPAGGVKVTGYATDAARYCAITGGDYQADESASSASDQEQGTCTLPDGQECDVWDYYNGACTTDSDTDTDTDTAATDSDTVTDAGTDPFAYCSEVGTDDSTMQETGDQLPEAIVQGMIAQNIVSADAPASIQQAAYWRCMDGNVWVCTVGANLPCAEKADLSDTPTQAMTDFCQENADSDAIPAAVTGRATVYSWSCQGETAVAGEQILTADAEGYLSQFWYELTPAE